jgi:hypothetical protein
VPPPQQRPERHGKTKLHMLNPMSLLIRRRNVQPLEHLEEESLITHGITRLPDNYDPSIRGKIVHDFGNPSARPIYSSQGSSAKADRTESRPSSSRDGRDTSKRKSIEPYRHEREHSAVFKEHFEEDEDKSKATSAIRAETLANKDFIARNSFPPPGEEAPTVLPPFARTAKTVYRPADALPLPARAAPSATQIDQPVSSPGGAVPLSPLLEDPVSPLDRNVSPLEANVSPLEGTVSPTTRSVRTVSTASTRKPPSSRSRVASRTSLGSDFQVSGLPSHMFSRSSRFSFQYGNTDSAAQEKLLEERHKEKAAAARAKALAEKNREAEEDQSEEEDDDFDYDDDMDGYDGMEEDVPTIGEEWDYGGRGINTLPMNILPMNNMMMGMNGLSMQQAAQMALRGNPVEPMQFSTMQFPPAHGLGILASIPDEDHDEEDQPAPIPPSPKMGNDTPHEHHWEGKNVSSLQNNEFSFDDKIIDGSERRDPSLTDVLGGNLQSTPSVPLQSLKSNTTQEDDFYFDDGEFDGADFDETAKFDESVLDDPSHHLFERQPKPPPIPAKSVRRLRPQSTQRNTTRQVPPLPGTEGLSEIQAQHPDPGASLEIVTAYHDALVSAANRAAAEGRFVRHDSVDTTCSDVSEPEPVKFSSEEGDAGLGLTAVSSRPSLVPDDSRLSQATTMSPPTNRALDDLDNMNLNASNLNKAVNFSLPNAYNNDPYSSEWDYSDYDSAMEDDHIIAAANAEALENDEDGFYGTEFGFYARPGAESNSETGESSLGGYFGPKDWGEIKRQRSTREPNLTPITERSEYSTRNSFINLVGDRALPSPGLAALARMSGPAWESEINMETLRKLRRGAFGGSQGSLRSSGHGGSSPMNSSPNVSRPDPRALWSSPMSREVSAGDNNDEDNDHSYDDYLDEANFEGNDGDDDALGDWEDASNSSSDYDEDDDVRNSGWQYSAPDSPTIRAQAMYAESPTLKKSAPRIPSPSYPSSPPTTGSTTLTSQTTINTSTSASPFLLQSPSRPLSMDSQPSPTKPSGHSRQGSDSVAYVRERDDERGEMRWFLERRRTNEDGVESLIGRTLVEGGRI